MYLCTLVEMAKGHRFSGIRECSNAHISEPIKVLFHSSAMQLCSGWCGKIVLGDHPTSGSREW